MVTALAQLKSCGAFDRVNGILLGTFSTMEENNCAPDMPTLVKAFAGKDLPIAKTEEIGHGRDSKAIWIGKEISLKNSEGSINAQMDYIQ